MPEAPPQPVRFNIVGYDTLQFEYATVSSQGRVRPMLNVAFKVRINQLPQRPQMGAHQFSGPPEVLLRHLFLDVRCGSELVAQGQLRSPVPSITIHGDDTQVSLDVEISPAAIRHIDVTARGDDVKLMLNFINVGISYREMSSGDAVAAWREAQPAGGQMMMVTVPRSEWVKNVLDPIGTVRYIWMELPLPALPADGRWQAVQRHLNLAEQRHHEGFDADVLRHCHDALAALAEAPTEIIPTLADEAKRRALDAALQKFRSFLHEGRHPDRQTGLYDADHRDAEFALASTKIWLTYLARLVVRGSDLI